MNVLVTGASGFIGSQVVQYLHQQQHQVAVLVRPDSHCPAEWKQWGIAIHVHRSPGIESLCHFMQQHGIETVMHGATHYVAEHHSADIAPMVAANIALGMEVWEAMHRQRIQQAVYLGTLWQRSAEGQPAAPNLYAATKQAFESVLQFYAAIYGMSTVVLLLSDTYGASDKRKKLFWALNQARLKAEALALSPAEQDIDILHIDDAVRAVTQALVLAQQLAGQGQLRHYAATGTRLSLRQLVERYCQLNDGQPEVALGQRPYRQGEVMKLWAAPVLPQWQQQIDLDTGLAALIAAQRQNQ